MPRLRDNADDFLALIARTSEARGLPSAFVEKDFWVTELLRAVVDAARREGATAVFKGGTSLSKAYGIIERFSEDVDILLLPPDALGPGARHSVLKRICEAAGEHLGVAPEGVTVKVMAITEIDQGWSLKLTRSALGSGPILHRWSRLSWWAASPPRRPGWRRQAIQRCGAVHPASVS